MLGDDASLRRMSHPRWVHTRTRRVRLPWVFEKVPSSLGAFPLGFGQLSLVFRQKAGVLGAEPMGAELFQVRLL